MKNLTFSIVNKLIHHLDKKQLQKIRRTAYQLEQGKKLTQEIINNTVLKYLKRDARTLENRSRRAGVVKVRQYCQYFGVKYKIETRLTLWEIGEATGGKDHSTVHHSYKTISKLMDNNNERELKREIKDIDNIISKFV